MFKAVTCSDMKFRQFVSCVEDELKGVTHKQDQWGGYDNPGKLLCGRAIKAELEGSSVE